MYIDTHCHLDSNDYNNIDEVIRRVKNNIIIVSGVDDRTNKEVIELCNKFDNVYGTLGLHPNEIKDYYEESLNFIEKNLINPKIVGVGEIGLDYHFNEVEKELQQEVFKKQMEIAKRNKKTIVIHSRDAALDTFNILKNFHLEDCKVVMHCYSYSLEMAREFIKMNVKLGIGGVVTFKNASKLKEIVKEINLDNLLLETDSPYLTPEPYRGQKNEPSFVIYIAKEIAKIKDISLEKVLDTTTRNAKCQFDLNIDL